MPPESLQTITAPRREANQKGHPMTIGGSHLHAIISIAFGVLILMIPRLLNYFVAIYLILTGLIGLGLHLR